MEKFWDRRLFYYTFLRHRLTYVLFSCIFMIKLTACLILLHLYDSEFEQQNDNLEFHDVVDTYSRDSSPTFR